MSSRQKSHDRRTTVSLTVDHLLASLPLTQRKIADFRATIERPLFRPSRRPPAVPKIVPKRKLIRKPRVERPRRPPYPQLIGILSNGLVKLAVLKMKGADNVERIELGQSIGGWKLIRIGPGQAVLRHREEVVSLDVFPRREAAVPGKVKPLHRD